MRKILIASAILLVSFVAKQASAQTLPAGVVVVNSASVGGLVNNVTLTVISKQAESFGQPVQTLNNNLDGSPNLESDQSTLLGAAAYWVNPSALTPLVLTINSGNSIQFTNGGGSARSYFVQVSITNEDGSVVSNDGSVVSIGANQTGTLSIPAISNTYISTTYLQNNPTWGVPTPIVITVFQSN